MSLEWELHIDGHHVLIKNDVVPVLIGRSFDQPMLAVAPEANAFVSRHHVEIKAVEGALWCTDLGSANGTWIRRGGDSIRAGAHQRIRLEIGDVLTTIGDTVLCTVVPADSPRATPDEEVP